MNTIGLVRKKTDGSFAGHITTLAFDVSIRILPVAEKPSDELPDYRVLGRPIGNGKRRECHLGAGWIRISKSSGAEYVSLKLDDPSLCEPIHASLGRTPGQDEDTYVIVWNR